MVIIVHISILESLCTIPFYELFSMTLCSSKKFKLFNRLMIEYQKIFTYKTPIFVQQQVSEIWRELKQTSSENLSSAVIDTYKGGLKKE